MEGWMSVCVYIIYTDEWKDGWMEGCVYIIYTDEWMDEYVCVHYIYR